MFNGLEQIEKAVQEQLPRALVTVLIPAGHFAWKKWQEGQAASRVAVLRKDITELGQFLQTPIGESPSAIAIRQSTQQQYDKALNQLAELCRPPHVKIPEQPVARSLLRRVFLLYTPRSGKGWLAHSLYYLFLALMVLGTFGALAAGDISEALGAALAVIGVYGLPAFFIWRWADRMARPATAQEPVPQRRSAWAPVTLIWIAALAEFSTLVNLSTDNQDDFSLAVFRQNIGWVLFATAACVAVIFLCIRWRQRLNANRVPGPRWAWVPITVSVIAGYMGFSAVAATATDGYPSWEVASATVAGCAMAIVANIIWRRRMKQKFEAQLKLAAAASGTEQTPEIKKAAAS